jgi:cation diffusion facilitator CzcD-associated flavoprotein CzcO
MVDVAVIGAGPYGLSTAVHLRRAGIEPHVLGDPMSFWREMPRGMFLRSNFSATNIAEPTGPYSLKSYMADIGETFGTPVPLDRFVAYGTWLQERAVPDVDRRQVASVERAGDAFALELDDGTSLTARRVVVAAGIAPFVSMPAGFEHLPDHVVSHTGAHSQPATFAGRRVAIVGGGQSALESAALLREAGADVEVFVRRDRITWLRGGVVHRKLGRLAPVVYAPTDVGPLWYSRLVSVPDLFRRLPRRMQTPIAYRCIRPACSQWAKLRLDDIPIHLDTRVMHVESRNGGLLLKLEGGETREIDHLMFGTGYRVDVARYPFLGADILGEIERANGYPLLKRGLESSVAGLHFIGAPAAWSFGPTMRFVSGSWYAGRSVARALAEQRGAVGMVGVT